MPGSEKSAALTEHESHILAIIQREQPITTYRIRKRISASPTAGISSSAGAVYPLVKRLVEKGYIRVAPVEDDRRKTEMLMVTETGRAAILKWIATVSPAQHLPEDPVRTRAFYMGQLPVSEQIDWLSGLQRGLERKLGELDDYATALPEARFAHRHALMVTQTRLEWVKSVLAELTDAS